MGNQLAVSGAAASVNLSDISPTLSKMPPLGGGRRGRLFTSLHCSVGAPATSSGGGSASGAASGGADGAAGAGVSASSQLVREIVVKVFVRTPEDKLQAQLIVQHHETLLAMEKQIAATAAVTDSWRNMPLHVLFYSEMDRRDERACKLVRPYVHYSIAERLQSRPSCSDVQRLFFSFQLLEAVAQLHDVFHCVHGDLKMENVLVNSQHWVYVVDFSPFKPARLPSYNPANFEFYYDVSESRVCCVAPEAFFDAPTSAGDGGGAARDDASLVSSVGGVSSSPSVMTPTSSSVSSSAAAARPSISGHTSTMDVFAAACVIAQILTDEPLFRLSGVLELRSKPTTEERRQFVLSQLREHGGALPVSLAEWLAEALSAGPSERPTARELIRLGTPTVFPRYFELLHNEVLPQLMRVPPDVHVLILHSQWHSILRRVEQCCSQQNSEAVEDGSEGSGATTSEVPSPFAIAAARRGAVTLLLAPLTAVLRHLKTTESRCQALHILRMAAHDATPATMRDVIIPFTLHYLRKPNLGSGNGAALPGAAVGLVRAQALRTLREVTDAGELLFQPTEALLFDDYIFPVLRDEVAPDHNRLVRTAMAEHLPHILQTSKDFLEWRQVHYAGSSWGTSYDEQLHTLLTSGWELLKPLYKPSDPLVILTVLQKTPVVAAFLGEERAQDELLPLLTASMSASPSVQRELLSVAIQLHAQLQSPRPKTLKFFAEEGLTQKDAGCVLHTLLAINRIIQRPGHIPVSHLTDLVLQVVPHLAHPVRWIQLTACTVVESATRANRPVDVLLRLEGAVRPFLTCAVPLRFLSTFPDAVKAELGWLHSDYTATPLSNSGYEHHVGAKVPLQPFARQSVVNVATTAALSFVGADSGTDRYRDGISLQMPPGVSTSTASEVTLDSRHVDIPPSAAVSAPASAATAGGSESDGGAPRTLAVFNASERCKKRWQHQQKWERSCGTALLQVFRQRANRTTAANAAVSNPSQSPSSAVAGSAAAAGDVSPRRRSPSRLTSRVQRRANAVATSSGSFSPAAPTAARLFHSCEHEGPVYCMDSTGGLLVTAGTGGVVKLWDVAPDDYAPVPQVVPTNLHGLIPKSEVSTVCAFVNPSHQSVGGITQLAANSAPASPACLLVGGTGGVVRVIDVDRQTVLRELSPTGATTTDYRGATLDSRKPLLPQHHFQARCVVTSLTPVHYHSVHLVSTSDGWLTVVDLRDARGAVWSVGLSSRLGPVSSTMAIGPTDTFGYPSALQHAFAAGTLTGNMVLFDLRYRVAVAEHRIVVPPHTTPSASAQGPRSPPLGPSSPVVGGGSGQHISIVAMSPVHPPSPHPPSQYQPNPGSGASSAASPAAGSSVPSVWLGTRSHGVLRVDVGTGEVQLQMATYRPAEVRAMVAIPRTNTVVAGYSDRVIRTWNAGTPSSSSTLCCTPETESPKYSLSNARLVEEGPPQVGGFGPRPEAVRKTSSTLQEHLGTVTAYRQHHADQITALHALTLKSTQYIVSAARDGSLSIWHNQGAS